MLCPTRGSLELVCRNSLRDTAALLKASGIPYQEAFVVGRGHVGTAREDVLWDAWHGLSTRPTHFLWIDSDMGWDAKDVLRLINHNYEFVAAAGMKKQDEPMFCGSFLFPMQRNATGCIEMAGVGMAFTLMKVSVIEKMMAGCPELRWHNAAKGRDEWALFLDMITDRGLRLTEDLSFCERWRKLGGRIWCDPDIALRHVGLKEYTGKLADYIQIEDAMAVA